MDDERLTSDPNVSGARVDAESEAALRKGTRAAGLSMPLSSFLDILAEIAFEDALERDRQAEETEPDDTQGK